MARVKGRWRGPREIGEYPTLGYEIGKWIETYCVVPDGRLQGESYVLTDEQLAFLLKFFRLYPDAKPIDNSPSSAFHFRGAQLMRPQKWGKSPFSAATVLAYAFAPVEFDGWDADGEPVGRPVPTPWIQIVSTSEAQTDNVWLALYEMAGRGPLADLGIDLGLMDINLPGGGKIEPRTSSGHARLGARITYAVFDETHLMTQSNGGLLLATTMKRGLSGMGGRWLETTNAYDPSENSVAQRTQESVVISGTKDILIDYRPPPHRPELSDEEDSIEMLKFCYGDSYWVDVNRIYADARDPSVCPTETDAMRYFFNLPEVGVDEAVDPTRWDLLARTDELRPHEMIALGFKGGAEMVGSNEVDRAACTSLVASRISDGRWFHIKTWDPSEFLDEGGFVRMRYSVNLTMTSAFKAYNVRFLVGDPSGWREQMDSWTGMWPKRVVELNVAVDMRIDQVIQRFTAAFAGELTHDGNQVLGAHAKSAAWARGSKRKSRPEEGTLITQHYLKVVKKWDNRPIDAFVAGLLAETARGLALEKGDGRPHRGPMIASL